MDTNTKTKTPRAARGVRLAGTLLVALTAALLVGRPSDPTANAPPGDGSAGFSDWRDCFADEAAAHATGETRAEAVRALDERTREHARMAALHRRSSRQLEVDPRRMDPQQREFVDIALRQSHALAESHDDAADLAAATGGCVEDS